MINWKRTRLEFTPETYDHIKKHRVRWFEIEEVFNHEFIPRKVRVENEIRYAVLGESFGRILMVIVVPLSGNRIRVITAYEPSDRRKRIYREKREEVIIMRRYHTKDEEDLIKQIESDDELSKEFEDAELIKGHVVSVHAATSEHGTRVVRKTGQGIPV
jgi:uncharacterized DUF497 family protein